MMLFLQCIGYCRIFSLLTAVVKFAQGGFVNLSNFFALSNFAICILAARRKRLAV